MIEAKEIITLPLVSYKNFNIKEGGIEVIRIYDNYIEVQSMVGAERKLEDDVIDKMYNYDYLYIIKKSMITQIETGYNQYREAYDVSVYTGWTEKSGTCFVCADRKSAFNLYKKLKNWYLQ